MFFKFLLIRACFVPAAYTKLSVTGLRLAGMPPTGRLTYACHVRSALSLRLAEGFLKPRGGPPRAAPTGHAERHRQRHRASAQKPNCHLHLCPSHRPGTQHNTHCLRSIISHYAAKFARALPLGAQAPGGSSARRRTAVADEVNK